MASGDSSAGSPAGPRLFDFGSDDVLCSYGDYTPQLDQKDNGKRSDPSFKDLHDNGVGRSLCNVNGQLVEFSREDAVYAVEKCMKKYADDVKGQLEGIAGRLTKLELYCCKIERSVGEFRTNMIRDQSETVLELKSLEKHVNEVHRSVQIIRDKKELSETQKELAKLQLLQKESIYSSHTQKDNEDLMKAAPEKEDYNDEKVASNQQLVLALPHQIASPPSSLAIRAPDLNQPYKELSMQQPVLVSHSVSPHDYVLNHPNAYNTHCQLLPQEQQSRNLQPVLHYAQQRVQMQDLSLQQIPKQQQNLVANQPTQQQVCPQYKQHWSLPMQFQQPSSQSQPPNLETPPSCAPYLPIQNAGTIPETYQGSSMSLPSPFSSVSRSSGYGVSGIAISHHPPQHNIQGQLLPQASQGSFGLLPFAKSGYVGTSTYPSQSNLQGCNSVYVIDGNRASPHKSFHPGSYPPNGNVAVPQMSSNHPYVDMIEKAVSMGYPRDQVVSIVRGTGES